MKRICLLFTVMAIFLTGWTASAQTVEISGTVIDATTGDVVPGASVQLKDAKVGISANADGKYSLRIPAAAKQNGVLIFSFIGYKTEEVPINGRSVVDCRLEQDATALEETIIIGYGTGKKVGSLVGSVTTVKSETIKNAPSSSALDQLQGQVAGMSVLTSGGVAGDNNVSIKIHGVGSLSSSTAPLYIIDGIPSSSRAIMSMNPNDIASISILKDASATSIYGSRAANGVVYITTKTGQYNTKSTVTVRSQAGISTIADDTLYDNMMSGSELKDFWVHAGIYTPQQINSTYTSKGWDANTRWVDYFQQFNNPQYQNDVTVEGGGQKVAYMVGASQFHQRGTAIGNYFDRYTVRTNVQGRPKDWLKVGGNLALSYTKRQLNGNWSSSDGGNGAYLQGGLSYLINPLYPAIDSKTGKEYETQYPSGNYNSHYYMDKSPSITNRYGFTGNFTVEITPFKNFVIKSVAGMDGTFYNTELKAYPSMEGRSTGTRRRTTQFAYTATVTNTLEYSFDINRNHEFSVLVGQEGISNRSDYFYAYASGLTDDRLMNLQNGTAATRSVTESYSQSTFLSFFGHADYTAFGKYILDATVRNDSSSRFGSDNRSAWFWSVGGLWKIKREGFLRDARNLNDLNLKASYGTQGNAEIGDYSYQALIGTLTSYADATSMGVGQPSNNALTWEKQGLFTVALSGRAFDRFDFDVEYYRRKTTSMLMDVPYPYTSGFTELTANVGGLLNQGLDVTLGVDILQSRDYFLRFSTTFNYNKQKITELFDGRDRWEIANTGTAYVVGKPVSFYYPIWAGINSETGQQEWYLPGEDVDKTTKKETTTTFDEASLTQNTGKPVSAPINGGFSISGGWKGITVAADFSYVIGKWLINNDAYFYSNPNVFSDYNQNKEVSDFWTPNNTDARFPDWSTGAQMQFDTHILENASFLRLKNLQVGYSFPKKLLDRQNVLSSLRFTFTTRNLWTLTKYSGIDPEVDSNLTYGGLGNSKQYLFGVELTF